MNCNARPLLALILGWDLSFQQPNIFAGSGLQKGPAPPLPKHLLTQAAIQNVLLAKNAPPAHKVDDNTSAITREWIAAFNRAADSNDVFYEIAVDANGNIYAAGAGFNAKGDTDMLLVKYDQNGARQWSRRYNGAGHGGDAANAITLDAAGNIFIGGEIENQYGNKDYVLLKYNSAGARQGIAWHNGAANWHDGIFDLVCDAEGNVFATGYSYFADSPFAGAAYGMLSVKYNNNAVALWIRPDHSAMGRPEGADAAGYEVVIDGNSNVIVAGYTRNNLGNWNYRMIKYQNFGDGIWLGDYGGFANLHDVATDLALDSASNIYVTGQSMNAKGDYDFMTIKFSQAGYWQWSMRHGGAAQGDDMPTDLAVDAEGNAYVTGRTMTADGTNDIVTLKYAANNGAKLWMRRYDGPGHGEDGATRVLLDGENNVLISGYSTGASSSLDAYLLSYSSAGDRQWHARFDGAAHQDEIAYDLALDPGGKILHAGYRVTARGTSDGLLLKLNPALAKFNTARETQTMVAPSAFALEQNYPNPFNPTTAISFQLPVDSEVSLSIYNMKGQLVKNLIAREMNAGRHSFVWDATNDRNERVASGVYMYVIKAGEFTAHRKLMLMK